MIVRLTVIMENIYAGHFSLLLDIYVRVFTLLYTFFCILFLFKYFLSEIQDVLMTVDKL